MRSLKMTQNRYAQGVDTRADIGRRGNPAQGRSSQAIDLTLQRAQLEHAVAVLVGHPRRLSPCRQRSGRSPPPPSRWPAFPPSSLNTGRHRRAERRLAVAFAGIVWPRRLFPRHLALGSAGYQGSHTSIFFPFRMRSGRSAPGRSCRSLMPARSGPVSRPAPRTMEVWPPTARRFSPHSREVETSRCCRHLGPKRPRCRPKPWRRRGSPQPSRSINTRRGHGSVIWMW